MIEVIRKKWGVFRKNKVKLEENIQDKKKSKIKKGRNLNRKPIKLDKETKRIKEEIMRIRKKKINELKEKYDKIINLDERVFENEINDKKNLNNTITVAVIGPEQYRSVFLNLVNDFWDEIDGLNIVYKYYGAWGSDEQQVSIYSILDNDIIIVGPNDHVWKNIPSKYNGKIDGIFQFIKNKQNSKDKLISKYLYKSIPDGSQKRPKLTKTIFQRIILESITAYITKKNG